MHATISQKYLNFLLNLTIYMFTVCYCLYIVSFRQRFAEVAGLRAQKNTPLQVVKQA